MRKMEVMHINNKKLIEYSLLRYIRTSALTGRLEIPYWIEGEAPERPIDICGIAGKVPKGFVGADCPTIEL